MLQSFKHGAASVSIFFQLPIAGRQGREKRSGGFVRRLIVRRQFVFLKDVRGEQVLR